MAGVAVYVGRGVVLPRGDVDTDQIIPASYCRSLEKTGYAEALFAAWREDPRFVLNQPRSEGATILLAGPNFGTGSSREHAVWALRDWGFQAVIAPGFGDIFARNALRNALLAVALPGEAMTTLIGIVEAEPSQPIAIDIRKLEVRAGGSQWPFALEDRARRLLLDGVDEIGLTLAAQSRIAEHERSRPRWLPQFAADRGGR